MEHIMLNIDHLCIEKAVGKWWLHDRIKMQRLYYIIGGKGEYRDSDGVFKPMEHGKIYIFPYNFYADFRTDACDGLEHMYFDFLSAPHIIKNTPIIYDVPDGSEIKFLAEYAMRLFERFDLPQMTEKKVSYTASALHGGFDEERQIIYGTLSQILLTLSHIREIPFLKDDIVGDAVKYIRENVGGDLSLKSISANFGYEMHYFIRRFKDVMNETPHAYIRNYRLLRAKELLAQGYSCDETAKKVGYMSGKSLYNALSSQKPG